MALTKRGKYWHYDFIYKKKRYQGSTDQSNHKQAKLAEAKVRSDAALEAFGIIPPKLAPMFRVFMETRFLPHVRQHNAKKPRTVAFYEEKTNRLLEFTGFTGCRLSEIDADVISKYKMHRSQQDKKRNGEGQISSASINRELATLRKALNLAEEWKLIQRCPKIRLIPGEKGRDFVVSHELEKKYLSLVDYPLKQAAILMLDLGLRPEECLKLRKCDVSEDSVTVPDGKTANAVRSIPHTARTKQCFELMDALWPDSLYFFKGHKKGSHLTRAGLDHMHSSVRDAENSGLPKEFILYSLRHTFGTRLAESGAHPFEIKAAMGHSDIRVSQKYIHPSSSHLELALKRKEEFDRISRGETTVPAVYVENPEIVS